MGCNGWNDHCGTWQANPLWVDPAVTAATTAATGPVDPSEESFTGCVVLKNLPHTREYDNCANFLNGGTFEFSDSVAAPVDMANMPASCQCAMEGTCAPPAECNDYMQNKYNSADWMKERVFAQTNSTDPRRRCWVHVGDEGSSPHNGEKKIRPCWEYSALKKNADWGMNGTYFDRTAYFTPMEEYYDRNGLRFCIFDIPDLTDEATFYPQGPQTPGGMPG